MASNPDWYCAVRIPWWYRAWRAMTWRGVKHLLYCLCHFRCYGWWHAIDISWFVFLMHAADRGAWPADIEREPILRRWITAVWVDGVRVDDRSQWPADLRYRKTPGGGE